MILLSYFGIFPLSIGIVWWVLYRKHSYWLNSHWLTLSKSKFSITHSLVLGAEHRHGHGSHEHRTLSIFQLHKYTTTHNKDVDECHSLPGSHGKVIGYLFSHLFLQQILFLTFDFISSSSEIIIGKMVKSLGCFGTKIIKINETNS